MDFSFISDFFFSIPSFLYIRIFNYSIMLLCIVTVSMNIVSNGQELLRDRKSLPIPALLLTLFFIIFLGLRPISGYSFQDMSMYAYYFNNISDHYVGIELGNEWLFTNFTYFCKEIGLSDHSYFLAIESIYIGGMFFCCWKLFPNNTWISMLFCLASFSFWGYGVNGLRNGMGCSVMTMAIPFMIGDKYHKAIAVILAFLAIGFHKSLLLPFGCAIIAMYFLEKPKYSIYFWISSIVVSFLLGNIIADFFSSLGFDDKMTQYIESAQGDDMYRQTSIAEGFRFDFLLYSAVPVLMTWYVSIKRNFQDRMYHILSTTYILSNAFWIMVIRAEFSNRFAYLSWFLYPFVLIYPLLRYNLWKDQDKKTVLILFLYEAFTFFMFMRDTFLVRSQANF